MLKSSARLHVTRQGRRIAYPQLTAGSTLKPSYFKAGSSRQHGPAARRSRVQCDHHVGGRVFLPANPCRGLPRRGVEADRIDSFCRFVSLDRRSSAVQNVPSSIERTPQMMKPRGSQRLWIIPSKSFTADCCSSQHTSDPAMFWRSVWPLYTLPRPRVSAQVAAAYQTRASPPPPP